MGSGNESTGADVNLTDIESLVLSISPYVFANGKPDSILFSSDDTPEETMTVVLGSPGGNGGKTMKIFVAAASLKNLRQKFGVRDDNAAAVVEINDHDAAQVNLDDLKGVRRIEMTEGDLRSAERKVLSVGGGGGGLLADLPIVVAGLLVAGAASLAGSLRF